MAPGWWVSRFRPGAAALLVLLAACRGDRPANILLVTLDTVRADRFGPRPGSGSPSESLTPRFDALAAGGVRFDNAVAVAPLTLPAHSTIHTGLLPGAHGVRDNVGFRLAESHWTLAEQLRASGYRTGGFVSAFVLDRRWGLAQGFDTYFDAFTLPRSGPFEFGAVQRRGDATVDHASAWMSAAESKPFFAWVHLYDPHAPYAAPEPYASRYPGRPYDAEIAWTDALVGRLLDSLAAAGLTDRTVIAVLGDHGESLGEHGEAEHGYFVYDVTQHIPFALTGPHPALRPRHFTGAVSQVDVAATLLDVARAGVPVQPIGGVSLRARLEPSRSADGLSAAAYGEAFLPRLHYGWSELRFLRTGKHKLIAAPRPELFDVEADPGETRNLYSAEPRLAASMEREIARRIAGETERAPSASRSEDAETRRALAALGYASPPAAPAASDAGADLPDPKDRLEMHRAIQLAQAQGASDPRDAIRALREVLESDPSVVQAWQSLGEALARERDWRGAEVAFAQALRRRPENVWSAVGHAEALVALGRSDAAVEVYRSLLERAPQDAEARYRLGMLRLERGEDDDARRELNSALEQDPESAGARLGLATIEWRAGRVDAARSRLDEVLSIDSAARGARHLEAQILEKLGELDAAIAACRQELAAHADSPRTSFQLGALLERSGRPREAVEAYELAAGSGGIEAARFFLARALFAAGDPDRARIEAERALSEHPQGRYSALGHYVLADLAMRAGDPAEAERQGKIGRALQSRFPTAAAP